ncbi:MAG: bifunctional phosphoribosylaminoimidazolecarboxamide formyltransferase/IMP cyclohydrolase [Bacteroidia bacterium]|nr:bifunctional phosphoribosylaminoimidazolecarboxamide formyltransferase/IMP cyclohydrolase [Bacteroidia bacterium]
METKPLRAFFSVWDKGQALPLAQAVQQLGGEIWASAGTARSFAEWGVPVQSIETLTGFSELLGGRVKTLHPVIFAGILARPEESLPPPSLMWDMVVVELYPFDRASEEWIELIDIGGVSLLRAAAKNYARVWAIFGPDHYHEALQAIQRYKGLPPIEVRYHFAAQVFALTAAYDARIAQGFLAQPLHAQPLRYGENPHQPAFFLGAPLRVLAGKPLSYNNLLDLSAGRSIVAGWEKPACAILKHTQPCGAAYADEPEVAYQNALAADPVAAYGGVVVCNFPITERWAQQTKGHFIEVLAAPSFAPEAVDWLKKHKTITLVELPLEGASSWEVRSALGGLLWQRPDVQEESLAELRWAARLLRTLYSNAVVITAEGQLIAAASGQTSRIEAVRLAIERAKRRPFPPSNLLLASDGFFPFTDSLELIYEAGIRQVAVPRGGKRQAEIEAFAQKRDICLTFLDNRHFRH